MSRLSPRDVARIRGGLGLSKRKAGRVLGGGPNAFARYESGEATPSQPLCLLLRLLDARPELLAELVDDPAATPTG